jgi:hypothetical protein
MAAGLHSWKGTQCPWLGSVQSRVGSSQSAEVAHWAGWQRLPSQISPSLQPPIPVGVVSAMHGATHIPFTQVSAAPNWLEPPQSVLL